jgi:predicted nucleic acid-binding protein
MAVLVDTGILLRVFVPAEPKHRAIRNTLRELRGRGEELVTAVQNIAEFSNVSTRPATARGGYGFPATKVDLRIQFLDRLCRKLYENADSHALWRQLVVSRNIAGVSVHDARLVSIMLANGVSQILTLIERDFRRYEPDGITILVPQ